MRHSVTELPFNRLIGLQRAGEPPQLQLPAGEQYQNHLGTVHASALLALAEAASGEFLLHRFGPDSGLIPVVRHLESKFRKPAHGSVIASATALPEELAALDPRLSAKGRASITVELHDSTGAHVLTAKVDWFIVRASLSESSE